MTKLPREYLLIATQANSMLARYSRHSPLVDLQMPINLFKYNQSMARLEVKKLRDFPDYESEVIVRGGRVTTHRVTVNQAHYEQLMEGAVPPEKLVEGDTTGQPGSSHHP